MLVNCAKCGKPANRLPKDIRRNKSGLFFCSKECRVILNSWQPKRKRKTTCKNCPNKIISGYTYCPSCLEIIRETNTQFGDNRPGPKIPIGERTLRYIIERRKECGGMRQNKYNEVRRHAKQVVANGEQICAYCRYSLHVEVAHLKEIAEFGLDTPLKIINAPENLILLCPNHHWEFDHDCLTIDEIRQKSN